MERSIPIKYTDGSVVRVKPVKRKDYQDLLELQVSLFTLFIESDLLPGDFLLNPEVIGYMEQTCSMIPLIGEERSLELDKIAEESGLELIAIFVTTTSGMDEETGAIVPEEGMAYSPSLIAKLHGFSFFHREGKGILGKARKKWEKKRFQQEQQAKEKRVQRTKQSQATKTLTPLPA